MAKTYYDSVFTGAEIDAAVRVAGTIAAAAVPENCGKLVGFGMDGAVQAVNPPAEYDDSALSDRVSNLENTINGLLDATGVSF